MVGLVVGRIRLSGVQRWLSVWQGWLVAVVALVVCLACWGQAVCWAIVRYAFLIEWLLGVADSLGLGVPLLMWRQKAIVRDRKSSPVLLYAPVRQKNHPPL